MDYEPITKGLREYIERHPTMMHAVGLTDQCDNIDAIHRSLEAENERLRDASERGNDYAVGYKAGHTVGFDEGFASADDWLAEHEGAMAEHGWVRGPIGADGKPMSDEHMVVDNGGDVGVIVETRFYGSNWFVLVDFGKGKSARFVWFLPKNLTHYHEPTVEDVLREFADGIKNQNADFTELAIAEYAKRLQLAEEE